jgi:Helicase conserved C-terminal domain
MIFPPATLAAVPEDDDDLNAEEQENLEESLIDQATASQTIAELADEISSLQLLEQQAKALVASGKDRKWDELSRILQNEPQMHDASGRMRKIIIFSEHRDTLNYLHEKIAGVLGSHNAIVVIHGGVHRDDRRKAEALFRSDPETRVLVATDAAGEGINLQNANLMVNYDLPWNPNRLEQRFGRIHRIGQQEVCHLWNLVAKETREGDVYFRLLEKLRVVSEALKGQVFNVLGEVFDGNSLKEMLLEAIRYGDRPEVRARLSQKIDNALDRDHVISVLNREALAPESMSPERLFAVKEEMEKAEARRLQPYFVRSFFMKGFQSLGGSIYSRESDRFEITHVPAELRERDRLITGRNRRDLAPVLKRYERVCFTKDAVRPVDRPGLAFASMIHPGHPLMLALSDVLLEQHANLLRQGTILVDPADEGDQPSLLFLLTHEIKSGDGRVISKRLQFVRVLPDGSATFAGWAPHLDLEPLASSDRPLLTETLTKPWLTSGLEQRALALAASTLVPEHFSEIAGRRIAHVDKTLAAVHERLTKEIDYWSDRFIKLTDDKNAGKDVRLNLENVRRTLSDLEARLESRKRELQSMRHVTSATPIALSGALVIPAGFRVYLDFNALDHIKLKVFLRSDIWSRIVDSGFREASHVTKVVTLTWPSNSLLNLIIKRILNNKALVDELKVDPSKVLASFDAQHELFYQLFPTQVDQGQKKPSTLDWIVSRCADGTDKTAPREVIHLLNCLREQEIARLEQGFPQASVLFDRSVFKLALPTVSEARLVQTLFAEYPECKDWISKLKGEKTEQTLESLGHIWAVTTVNERRAEMLVQIGFFQRRGSRDNPTFWVPFLYRDALEMIQGLADE